MHLDHPASPELQRPSRKGKERDPSHPPREAQVTDLDEKIIALRRKNAGAQRIRDRERMQNPQLITTAHQSSSTTPLASTPGRSQRMPVPQPPSKPPASSPRRPQATVSRPLAVEADHEEFSRRLKISSHSPRIAQPSHCKGTKLYNPDTDAIPIRRTAEPEQLSDATSSSYVQVSRHPASIQQREDRHGGPRQLFDYRKDDPVRFSVLARPPSSASYTRPAPTPKPSGDYISASSASSYAPSVSSSSFTLSSTTDGSSASSALFEGRKGPGTEDSGNNVFSKQLKRLYRTITELETTVKQEDTNDDLDDAMNSRVLLKGKELANVDADKEKWRKQIVDHKDLAETIHNLLEISLAPSVPVSLRTIPTKYNIIVRLWTYAFHKLLESLRRASFTSPTALEHLQDFIYYAYTFYTGLLEENNLASFKSSWLEALGDLARYKMAVSAMVNSGMGGQGGLTTKAVSEVSKQSTENGAPSNTLAVPAINAGKSISDAPAARIDDSPSPSVGIAAARLLEIEPEKERWRNIARDWYGAGLAEQPGTGKLHHHLGLLSREVETEELRGVYHFTKSMTCLHPFLTSRESVLPIWSHAAQARRALPDARVPELFVLLHGMLFTNIQLDDFQPTLARFIERLDMEGADEKEWIMMAIVNIASILEYGRPNGVLRNLGVVGPKDVPGAQQAAMRVMAKKVSAGIPVASTDDMMDVDQETRRTDHVMQSPQMSPPYLNSELPDRPPALTYALQLASSMLSLVLQRPLRQSSPYARSALNPYLTVMLTFLSTILKQAPALQVMERSIPWQELAGFFATIPRRVMSSQGLFEGLKVPPPEERWAMLTSSVSPPLSEDWCVRGMEWVGRKVFERGYWKSGDDRKAELEVLEQIEGLEISDGKIEDDDEEDSPSKPRSTALSELERRWVRICRSAVNISGNVEGLIWVGGTREWKVGGKLAQKVEQWKEEDRLERLEEERRRMGRRWTDDAMEIDDGEGEDISSESELEDENDSEEVKALKARRRYLKSLLTASRQPNGRPTSHPPARTSRKATDPRPALTIVPGYTILVVDTNVLLTSLSMITSLIESMKWTVVVPLPVVMELDGLSSNVSPQLADAASTAINYIDSHIRSHSVSLKVQTSKGNYLTSINVRTEEVDFSMGTGERSMDDLILKAAIWQDEHWQDRSGMLKVDARPASETANAVKVAFISLDRNLRLKARSRQLAAASEKDLASLMSFAT